MRKAIVVESGVSIFCDIDQNEWNKNISSINEKVYLCTIIMNNNRLNATIKSLELTSFPQ